MYLFTRRARVRAGKVRDAVEWASKVTEKARQVSGLDVSLFSGVFGPQVGTLVWSAGVPDLVALEAATDKLAVDDAYLDLASQGQQFAPDGADDRLLQFVFPDAETLAAGAADAPPFTYANVVSSVVVDGSFAKGVVAGIEVAELATEITGVPTAFLTDVTGQYGGVNWISGYADASAVEAAAQAMAASEEFVKKVDSLAGIYTNVPGATQQLLYRRII